AQGDRRHRLARPDPARARPPQDPLRQDHAPHPAQDRRERLRRARRYLHPGGSRRGWRPDRQPAEPLMLAKRGRQACRPRPWRLVFHIGTTLGRGTPVRTLLSAIAAFTVAAIVSLAAMPAAGQEKIGAFTLFPDVPE